MFNFIIYYFCDFINKILIKQYPAGKITNNQECLVTFIKLILTLKKSYGLRNPFVQLPVKYLTGQYNTFLEQIFMIS